MKYLTDYRTIDSLYILLFCFFLLFGGCAEQEEEAEIPEHIAELENLNILEPEAESVDSLELVKDREYGSIEEVTIGTIVEFAVDELGRVYIAEGKPGSGVIHVFRPDGGYLTTIGRYGRGPGDLLNTIEMQIRDKKLYVFNGVNSGTQISVFSTEDFSYLETVILRRGEMKNNEELAKKYPGKEMYVLDNGFLMNFEGYILSEKPEEPRHELYYHRSQDGVLQQEKKFELREMQYYYPEPAEGRLTISVPAPHSRRSLIAISDSGTVYTVWTEDFLIKVHDQNGEYQQAFYYPYQKSALYQSDLGIDDEFAAEVIDQLETDTWPALNSMLVDDENRLWVSTFIDSETHMGGILLNTEGEVMAKFAWPDNRTNTRRSKDRKIVRNGYFYTKVKDEETGLSTIARYQINTVQGEPFE